MPISSSGMIRLPTVCFYFRLRWPGQELSSEENSDIHGDTWGPLLRHGPGNEYSDVTRGLGGVVIDCASGNHKINIFEVRRIKLEDDVEDGAELPEISNESPMFLQHLSWLKDEFRIMMPEMPDSTLRALMIWSRECMRQWALTSIPTLTGCDTRITPPSVRYMIMCKSS